MKENILKILSEIQLRSEFKGAKYSLTLNYDVVLENRFNRMFEGDPLPDIMGEDLWPLINKKIDEVGDVYSFNFTTTIEVGTEIGREYADGWKSVRFIFYGMDWEQAPGKLDDDYGEDNKLKDPKNTCFFEFDSCGDRGSLRLSTILYKRDEDGSIAERHNICEYQKIGETLDKMLELDRVLDENFKNQCLIINKLKYVPVI